MDFTTAFLNGDLEETIFMEFPEGQGDSNSICQLRKSLYGLKQSPRNWYRKLDNFLIDIGFHRCKGGECLYFTDTCIIAVYVDDLAILGTEQAVKEVKATLASSFKMTDLGELRHFLGLEIDRNIDTQSITISQERYCLRILDDFHSTDSNPVATTFGPGTQLTPLEKDPNGYFVGIIDQKEYRQLVGSLMYLMQGSRPEISFATIQLSKYAHCPGQEHWKAARHLLKYLKKTSNMRLVYDTKGPTPILYTDSDFAGDITTRKSTSGIITMMSSGPVFWATKT
jgi:hypothetical protein